jgi:4-amino-4-deoxy-L-arabinose transferase-like glycosyltransferase
MTEEADQKSDQIPSPGSEPAPEILKKRIHELEEQVATLEKELDQKPQEPGLRERLRQHYKTILFVVLVLLLAGLPSLLVVRDRWFNLPTWSLFNSASWCQSEFLCYTSLPTYFAAIFLFTVLLFLVFLFWKEKSQADGTDNEAGANQNDTSALEIGAQRKKIGKIFLIVSLVFAGIIFIIDLFSDWRPGWGYLFTLLLFFSAWLILAVDWGSVWQFILRNYRMLAAFCLAQLALILFLAGLARGEASFPWLWFLLFLLAGANLVRFLRQVPVILWVFDLALIFFSLNINRWSFSTIGDEYAFYDFAREIVTAQSFTEIIANLFNGTYVYGTHPYLSSVIQAFSLRLFGLDSFGWRFSNVMLSASAIIFFYFFFKGFTKRSTALLVAFLLATSVYLMTFGKIGYNNLQSLFAMALALWAAGWAIHSQKRIAYVTLGFGLGFCFYVYPAALYIVPIPFLLLFFYRPPRSKKVVLDWGIMLLTLLIVLLPLFSQPDYWRSKGMGLMPNNPEVVQNAHSIAMHIFSNFIDAFYSFLYTPQETHFVPVGYFDPISAVLILIGLALAYKQMIHNRFISFSLLSFFFLLITVGVTHDRRYPPTTRMFLLLPWLAFFAAMALEWLIDQFMSWKLTRWGRQSLLVGLIVCIASLNLYQAYSLSLVRTAHYHTPEALFLRIVQNLPDFEPTRSTPLTFLFLTDTQWGIDGLYTLMRAYDVPASLVRLQREPLSEGFLPLQLGELIKERNTVVIMQPSMDENWKANLGAQLGALDKIPCDIKEYNQKDTRFVLWHAPELSALCSFDN